MRKSVLFITALLFMAVPAMAASTVTITCANSVVGDVNWVTVSYSTDHNLIRAFGLDITLTPSDGNITDVCALDSNYRIYPGQIEINDNGEVTDYNKPYSFSDINDANNNIAVEMGSLYTTDSNYSGDSNAGYNMIPGTSGTLLKFGYQNATAYTVDVNVRRGGIVMEDPCEVPTLDSPLCGEGGGCTVPDVLDMDMTGAEAAIIAANLTVGDITYSYSAAEAACEVLAQDPAPDTVVECLSDVNLTISAGWCTTCTGDISGNSIKNKQDEAMLRGRLNNQMSATGSFNITPCDALWHPCGDVSGNFIMNKQDEAMLRGQLNQNMSQTGTFDIPCP
jgi:hypothetical protein